MVTGDMSGGCQSTVTDKGDMSGGFHSMVTGDMSGGSMNGHRRHVRWFRQWS